MPPAPPRPGRFRHWIEADPTNRRTLLVALACVLALAIGAAVTWAGHGSSGPPVACGPLHVGSPLPDGSTLAEYQVGDARQIATIVMGSGIADPTQATVDALDAAWTETRLQNDPVGDRDSVGYFQERPSEGWGTAAEILDPTYATHAWLRRLEGIDGWAEQPPAQVAQEVERSGYPDRYQAWVTIARTQVLSLTGPATTCGGGTPGTLVERGPAGATS